MSVLSSFSPPSSSVWQSLPSKPGVYIFKDTSGKVLYVGKAKNLHERVRYYFQPAGNLGPKTARLVKNIASVDYIEVWSEVEALLLESRLIKKFRPFFNLAAKDDKSPYYIHFLPGPYPVPVINHESKNSLAGPFLNSVIPKRILRQFRHISPFHSHALKKGSDRPCLYFHLGLCRPCPQTRLSSRQAAEYLKNISRLKSLLRGNFTRVTGELNSRMKAASRLQDYETAAAVRDQISSLSNLLNRTISPEEYLVNPNLVADTREASLQALISVLQPFIPHLESLGRIEMYDIAHTSGDSATGAMTVSISGNLDNRQYRHFTIRRSPSNSDVDMLAEIVGRRLSRTDWSRPDLIVLDGGKAQLSILTRLRSRHADMPPVIALAKREETVIIPADGSYREINMPRGHPGLRLLQHLRDEAHRFSRRLHHKQRSRKVIS